MQIIIFFQNISAHKQETQILQTHVSSFFYHCQMNLTPYRFATDPAVVFKLSLDIYKKYHSIRKYVHCDFEELLETVYYHN